MTQPDASLTNRPITLQQKRTLIAVYQRTGNMTTAMREANIRSPRTAYLWWHRFCDAGEAGLQPHSHARRTQERLSDSIVEQVCQLRRLVPGWGRRKIADALTQCYGLRVASPASVEAVLRHAGLWEQASQPATPAPQTPGIPSWLGGMIDYERLLATAQTGIQLSLRSDARAATQVLYGQLWRPLEADPALWSRLLTTTEQGLGSWLLGSRLHLGHSLMNSGHWPRAVEFLRETRDWMDEYRDIGPRQRAWEEAPHIISLRRDDVWLGCYQHLAIVLGKSEVHGAIGYLQTARLAVERKHRPVVPGHPSMLGDLERDLAYLKLRLRRIPEAEIRQHLVTAQHKAEKGGSTGSRVFTHIAWARLYDRLAREAGERERATRQRQRSLMEQELEQAIQLVEGEQEDRPMRQTLCFVDAAQLAQAHGMPIEGHRVQRAAAYCLAYGYGDQARELLGIPGIHAWLPEEMWRNLTRMAKPA